MSEQATDVIVSQQVLIEEMQYILTYLIDQAKAGKRIRLSDARSRLTGRLTLDFADYFKFLKRYNYVIINRTDHGLAVTDEGRALSEASPSEPFQQEIKQHFGAQVQDAHELIEMQDESFPVATPAPEVASEQADPALADQAARPMRSAPSAEARASSKGIKFDTKYTRYETIGSGGIGTVYRGRLNSLSLDVAIKEIKELFSYFNFLQRTEVIRHLRDAVGQMALLEHPLVVKVIDQNTEVAHPYFVTEFLTGGNLRDLMSGQRIPLDRALTLFVQISYALRAAHRGELVHGNLKPENILFDTLGNVRVTDFGMTRLLQSDSNRAVPRVVTGSIGYLSPEQMADASLATPQSDLYSLGILLYELLTGNLPGRRSPLPSEADAEVPKALDDLFDRMTRDDPADRFPDVDALLDAFYAAFKDGRFLSKGSIILFADPPMASELDESPTESEADSQDESGSGEDSGKKKK
jgi:hypothetical protein